MANAYPIPKYGEHSIKVCFDCHKTYAYQVDNGCPYCKFSKKCESCQNNNANMGEKYCTFCKPVMEHTQKLIDKAHYVKMTALSDAQEQLIKNAKALEAKILEDKPKKKWKPMCDICFTPLESIGATCPNCIEPLKITEADNEGCSVDDALTMSEADDYAKEDAYGKAKKLGLKVVIPTNNVLMLDLDTDEQKAQYEEALEILQKLGDDVQPFILDTLETISKSGKKHAYVMISKNLKPLARIGLQAILGSDPKREVLSLRRVLNEAPINTVMFETQEEYDKVTKWMKPECETPTPKNTATNVSVQGQNGGWLGLGIVKDLNFVMAPKPNTSWVGDMYDAQKQFYSTKWAFDEYEKAKLEAMEKKAHQEFLDNLDKKVDALAKEVGTIDYNDFKIPFKWETK